MSGLERDKLFPDIAALLTEDDGVAEYCVEAAQWFENPGWAVTRYTHSRDSAQQVADQLSRQFHCVRLSEWAFYQATNGRFTTGWLNTWWSDVDYVGERPGGGKGIPDKRVQLIYLYRHSSRLPSRR